MWWKEVFLRLICMYRSVSIMLLLYMKFNLCLKLMFTSWAQMEAGKVASLSKSTNLSSTSSKGFHLVSFWVDACGRRRRKCHRNRTRKEQKAKNVGWMRAGSPTLPSWGSGLKELGVVSKSPTSALLFGPSGVSQKLHSAKGGCVRGMLAFSFSFATGITRSLKFCFAVQARKRWQYLLLKLKKYLFQICVFIESSSEMK